MPDIKAAANAVQTFRRQFQAVIDLADAVGEIGNLDQARSEAEARLRDKQKEEASIDTKIAAAQAKAESILADAESVKAAADKALADADVSVKKLLEKARTEAQKLVSDARAEATQIVTDAKTELKTLEASIAQKEAELQSVSEGIDEKISQHAALSGKIAEAKGHLSRLITDL